MLRGVYLYSLGKAREPLERDGKETTRVERLKGDGILRGLERPCASSMISERASSSKHRTREGAANCFIFRFLGLRDVVFCFSIFVIGAYRATVCNIAAISGDFVLP